MKKQSFISTDEGMREWKAMLEEEGRIRDKAIQALKEKGAKPPIPAYQQPVEGGTLMI